MRKTAQRKIRAQFKKQVGQEPSGLQIISTDNGVVAYVPSSWRRLKKSYLRSKV